MNLIQQIDLEAHLSAHSIHPLDACGLIDAVLSGVERGYVLTERVRECALTLAVALCVMPITRTSADDEDDAASRARDAGL